MDTISAVGGRRSIRQFSQKKIGKKVLLDLADGARMAPSAANLQPLHFLIVNDSDISARISATLKWATHLGNWEPKKNKVAPAFIIILFDSVLKPSGYEYEAGMAAENIMVCAASMGLGSCCLSVFNKKRMNKMLEIPERYVPILAIALGHPAEKSVVEEEVGSLKYWRDNEGNMHVPKRSAKSIVHYNSF